MGTIGHRDSGTNLADLGRSRYDLVVVGGGIYGAMIHLEAARSGLRSVLVERADFGGGTSDNSMRVIHGGLRYLKSLHLTRSIESTRERQWYLTTLPGLVAQLPCLLPLYGGGRKRSSVLKAGLAMNDLLSSTLMYLDGTRIDVPHGALLDAHTVRERAAGLPAAGLIGAATWYDLKLLCPGRVVIEALRWAADLKAVAVNYVEARELLTARGGVRGVVVTDESGASAELLAPVVINAAGPWAGEVAQRWDPPHRVPAQLVVAWNVLLDRPAISEYALALQDSAEPNHALLFATALGGRLLIGTGYAPLAGRSCEDAAAIAASELDAFLGAVNRRLPGLAATSREVLRVYSGVMPATAEGSSVPRARNAVVAHDVGGLFTVVGTKFTTARSCARQVLDRARRSDALRGGAAPKQSYPPGRAGAADGLFSDDWTVADVKARRASVEAMIREEGVEHLDDFVMRRTTLGDQPQRALAAASELCEVDERWRQAADAEVARLAARLDWRPPTAPGRALADAAPLARTA